MRFADRFALFGRHWRRQSWPTRLLLPAVVVGSTFPTTFVPVVVNTGASKAVMQYALTSPATGSWVASNLTTAMAGAQVLGTPQVVSGDGQVVVTARLSNGDPAVFVNGANGLTMTNLSQAADAPAAAGDPVPFLDQWGNIDVAYVTSSDHLMVVANVPTRNFRQSHLSQYASPWHLFDLTLTTGTSAYPGAPSCSVVGSTGVLAFRTTINHLATITINWSTFTSAPTFSTLTDVTATTAAPALDAEPQVEPSSTTVVIAPLATGDIVADTSTPSGWLTTDLSALAAAPAVSGSIAVATTPTTTYVVGLTSAKHAIVIATPTTLVTTPLTSPASNAVAVVDATALSGGPLMTGQLFLTTASGQLTIAGASAVSDDLYSLASPRTIAFAQSPWTATDVTMMTAPQGRAVGSGVTGYVKNGVATLLSANGGVPAHRGVGVYAIPYADWSQAMTDGWPILGITGGFGTTSAPWTGYSTPGPIQYQPDFLTGQTIALSHSATTWLSFWTVSGPVTLATQNAATYFQHGFAAGQWVARQIDQYAKHGLHLKPNWVILDPEGYPDAHSALDAPPGSTASVMATYAQYWSSMLSGWRSGLTSIDPALRPAVYASQSEYRNYGLVNQTMPVFQAVAFGNGGPLRLSGAGGSNILGFIAFGALCQPQATLSAEEQLLTSPPWQGQFNTLQFAAGVYCAP